MSSDLLRYNIFPGLSGSNCAEQFLNSLIVISGDLSAIGKEFQVLVVRIKKELSVGRLRFCT